MSRSTQRKEPVSDQNYKMQFGKYSGTSIKEILEHDPTYLKWLHENTDFELHADLLELAEGLHRPVDWWDIFQLQDKGLLPK